MTKKELQVKNKLIENENKYDDVLKEIQPVLDKIEKSMYASIEKKDFRNYDNKYSFMIGVKLQTILRKKPTLNATEIDLLYKDFDYLQEKINEIYDLVSYISVENEIPYIIDKQTVCSYLRITIDDYQTFMDNALYSAETQNLFKSMEDFLLSMYQQGAEGNLRNASAIKYRLGLKNKFGGNEVEEHITITNKDIKKVFDVNEIKDKLKNYNFIESKESK